MATIGEVETPPVSDAAARHPHARPVPIPLEAATVQPTAPLPALGAGVTIDTLLTPTTPAHPDPGFVHLGSLRIQESLFADFKAAENYLAKDPEALKLLAAMIDDKQPHTIIATDKHDPEGDRFDPKGKLQNGRILENHGGTIHWDPHGALRNTDGTSQTPAMALLHEQGHAWEFSSDPNGYVKGTSTKTLHYTTAEEQRNEKGLETRAAEILGEGKRTNHLGTSYEVAGPTSREGIAPKIEQTPEQLRMRTDVLVDFYKANGYPALPHATKIEPWDHKEHTGTFVQIDEHTAVQNVGGGKYQVYDIDKDLGGKHPAQFHPIAIDTHGLAQEAPKNKHELVHGR